MVYRRARRLLADEEEARDAMQEVFLRLARGKRPPGSDGPILHWLYRVTTNLCLNRLRQRKAHPLALDPDMVRQLVDESDPERRQVALQAVLHVMRRCDHLTQQVALHYHLDGMNMDEVAAVVGYSRKTVGKKLAAFKKKAQRLLEDTNE